jgi:DNA repair exonuclease SbcCD ATPase subunit
MTVSDLSRDSERILLALFEQGRMQTRELTDYADLDATQQVHYRYRNYLSGEYGLVEKHPPDSGKQAEWELTRVGHLWMQRVYDDIAVPQTPEEAVSVARTAMEKAESAEKATSTISGQFGQLDRSVSEALAKFDSLASEVDKDLDEVDEEIREIAQEAAADEVDRLEDPVELVRDSLEDLESDIAKNESEIEFVKESTPPVENVDKLSGRVKNVEVEQDDLDSRLTVLERKCERMENQFERIEGKIENLSDSVDEIDSDDDSNYWEMGRGLADKDRVDELENRIEELEESGWL